MWRSRLREIVSWTLVLLVVAALGVFAWASANPDHPWIARAAEWPGVGTWVESFRARYGVGVEDVAPVPSPESAEIEEDRGPEVEWVYRADAPPGPAPGSVGGAGALAPGSSRSGRDAADRSTVWVAAGDSLRRAPRDDAPVVARVDVFLQADVVERRGEWARVESTAGEGWVKAPEVSESYPMGSGFVPPRPLRGGPPPPDKLRIARELMGIDGPSGQLGPYLLYTDVDPPSRLATLDRLARQVEPAYQRRYGRVPAGEVEEAVLVFAEPESFRIFQSREARIRGIPTGGYARHGMLALWVGDRRPDELASTLIHEVVHLLNRRALGPALPPWLDEGMAYDLGAAEVSAGGDLAPDVLGGATVTKPGRVEYQGAVAGLRNLNASFAWDEPPTLEHLVFLDWDAFVRDEDRRELHYAQAGFFLRYLAQGEDGALRPALHRFLDRVASGAAPSGELLRQELGRSWEELDRGLGDFVRDLVLETEVEARRLGS